MWETSADVLNMSLAIGVGAVSVVLVFLIFYLILVVRDLSYASKHIRDTAKQIHDYVQTPVKIAMEVYKGIRDVMGWVEGSGKKKKK